MAGAEDAFRGLPPARTGQCVRVTNVTEYSDGSGPSVRLDACELDHLRPLLGFVGDELAKVGGCHRHRHVAESGEFGVESRIGDSGVNLFVEYIHDRNGRVPRRRDAIPAACVIAGYEFRHGAMGAVSRMKLKLRLG